MSVLLIVVGLVLLFCGGELLVRGATDIALRLRITPTVVGLTVVAAGTSAPEGLVSVQAAMAGNPDLSAGNIVGSNIFNIAMILGLSALMQPLRITGSTVRFEWPVMMLAAFQLYLLARDGLLDRIEGTFFLGALVAFLAYLVVVARSESGNEEPLDEKELAKHSLAKGIGFALLGVALLGGGANALIDGATDVARSLGVSEAVIGLTILSAGTSLPELAASVVAAMRRNADIAVANVIGSNTMNILAIAGITAVVHPFEFAAEILARDVWWMLAFSMVLFPLMFSGRQISRWEGALLFGGFLTYMAVLWPK